MKANRFLVLPMLAFLLLTACSGMLNAAETCHWSSSIAAKYERQIKHLEKPHAEYVFQESADKYGDELNKLHEDFLKSISDLHDSMHLCTQQEHEKSVTQINKLIERIDNLQNSHQSIKQLTHGPVPDFGRPVNTKEPSPETLGKIKQTHRNIVRKANQ